MLIFWSLVRNSVVLAVYLLFSVACFLTVHEHLRREYAGDITVKIGFELEYYPALFAKTLRFLCDFPIDYLIQGQHFLGNEYEAGAVYSGRPTEDAAVLQRYVEQTVAGMASGAYTYLAHPDLCNFVGDREIYREQMRRLCTSAKQLGCPLEVNFLGFMQHRCYPNQAFWQIAKEVGNDVVIGLDAHSPDAVLDQTTLGEMRAWIAAQGLTPLSEISLRDPHECACRMESAYGTEKTISD